MATDKRTLPNNQDAERACLGGVLLRAEVLGEVVAVARAEDFYVPAHRLILESMIRLERAGQPIDVVTLDADLDMAGKLVQAGGVEALAELASAVPSASNVAHYARLVRESSQLRQAIQIAREIESDAYSMAPAEKTLQGGIDALGACFRQSTKIRHIRDIVPEVRAELFKRTNAEWNPEETDLPPLGIPSGIAALDELLTFGGAPTSYATLVGADSSVGKSALANKWIRSATRYGPVFDCSFEDNAHSRIIRHLASGTGTNNSLLQRYVVPHQADWDLVSYDLDDLEKTDIYYLDEAPDSVDELCSIAYRHIQKTGCVLWVIDYAQLCPSGLDPRAGVAAETKHTMGTITRTARKLRDCATIVVSQFNQREDPEAAPIMKSFFGAASVVQDAHTILALHRPPKKSKDPSTGKEFPAIWCEALKQKNGPQGGVALGWWKPSAAFFDCADPQFMALLRRDEWRSETIRDLAEIYQAALGLKQ